MKIIFGENTTNKNEIFASCIKKALAEEKTVYLVVAKQFTFETERKFYTLLGAKDYNRIKVLSFNRLSEHIFLCSGEKPRYIDDVSKSILLFTAVKNCRDSILYFGKNCLKTSFIESLSILISELIQSDVTPEKLLISHKNPNMQEKLTDISIIYTEYLKLLGEKSLKDNMTQISEAANIANRTGFFKNSLVCLDEFDTLTKDQLKLFNSMLNAELIVSLTTKKDNKFFKNIHKLYSEICISAKDNGVKIEEINAEKISRPPELEYINYCLTELSPETFNGETNNLKIIEATDYYEEAEYVCAEIAHLVEKGYKYADIVVVTRNISACKNIFAENFKRYNIPGFIDVKQTVEHTSIVLLITTLLEIISERKFSTDTLMRYAKNELLNFTIYELDLLEEYCFKWSVDGESWSKDFQMADENLEQINITRKNLIEPIVELKNNCKDKTVKEICRNIYEYLEIIDLENNLNIFYRQLDVKNARELVQIYNYFVDYIDTFAELIGEKTLSLKEFSEIFTKTINSVTFSAPPQIVNAVKLLDASRTRLNPVKAVFVVGVNEDFFPATAANSGLLLQKEKENLPFKFGRELKEKNCDELLFFYKSLTSATEKLYISYPLSNTANQLLNPANQLLKLKKHIKKDVFYRTSNFGIEHYCITPDSAYHYYVSHYSENLYEIKDAFHYFPEYRNRIENIQNSSSSFNHKIQDKNVVKNIFGKDLTLAPTSFETLIRCPFKFFCEHGLKIKERSKKELNPLSGGNFIHFCLERIFRDYHKSFLDLSKDKIYDYIMEKAKEYLDINYGKSDVVNARFKANFKIISDSIVDVVREIQNQLAGEDWKPIAFEVKIGKNYEVLPFRCSTDGIEISIEGKIDRIDIYNDRIRIVDYKSGKKTADLKMLAYGLDFQLFFYLFAVEQSPKFQKFTPHGVMYMPAGVIDTYLERYSNEENVKEVKSDYYSMKGFTISEEKNAETNQISYDSFLNLKEFATDKVKNVAEKLYSGDVSAVPQKYNFDICNYCTYKDTCGNFPNKKEQERFSRADIFIKKVLNDEKKADF
jgi:ATP-dependent helicase/nuclease subunit B